MNVIDAIRARRSVRRFVKGAAIPREDVEALLEAAMLAPSAVNSRPWEFYCTDSAERKAQLMAAHPASRMLETASWAIVVCGRPDLQPRHGYWPQDCAAAVENILLRAVELGYGACWCGCYPSEPRTGDIRAVLGCTSVPVAMIALGVPDEAPAQKGFYDPERVTFL